MRLTADAIAHTFRAAMADGLMIEPHTSIVAYDLDFVGRRLEELNSCFPDTTLHTVAIKACPLAAVLRHVVSHGTGLEAASFPELFLAEESGLEPAEIVFDSPAKTRQELTYALRRGVHINTDSLGEIDRIAELVRAGVEPKGTVGARINPQVGTGRIASTSVAGKYSKFGIPLEEHREALLHRFTRHEWLRGLHVHVGSQGCPVEMLLDGVTKVFRFANAVDARLSAEGTTRRVTTFDIGGGLPVAYSDADEPVSMSTYANELRTRLDCLFGQRFRLITEFGRWVLANAGWVASRVEYVKRTRDINTAIIHIGADMFLRRCYRPEDWHHDLLVLGPDGKVKHGIDSTPYVVAGPLCFAGDVLGFGMRLPRVEEGDFIVVRDAGAYTLSMWSRYNSRQIPRVVGYHGQDGQTQVLREKETVDRVAFFWH